MNLYAGPFRYRHSMNTGPDMTDGHRLYSPWMLFRRDQLIWVSLCYPGSGVSRCEQGKVMNIIGPKVTVNRQ